MQMRSLFVPATPFELALRKVMVRVNKMPVTSPLFVRWRTKSKAARVSPDALTRWQTRRDRRRRQAAAGTARRR
ncbi:hypothetical protein [Nonomuraea sp. CA-141351]|uniref:hypothetical protein n=1 Tax=Nonomuraea sp. CA-141351 TaxID=3239996 RepID=UPI003D93CFF8